MSGSLANARKRPSKLILGCYFSKGSGNDEFERWGNRGFCVTADVRNGSCLKNAYGPIEPIRVSSAPGRRCSADATRFTRPGRRCGRVGAGETRRSEMVSDARDRHVRPTLVGRRRRLLERGLRGNG